MLYCGIDPGLNGAIACIDWHGKVHFLEDMPTIKLESGKRRIDAIALNEIIRRIRSQDDITVALEDVHAMPGQGVTSMFNMGYGLGVIVGVLASRGIQPVMVRPQTWKKHHGLIGKDKSDSLALARELFPHASNGLARAKDDGRAESLLIAHWLFQRAL